MRIFINIGVELHRQIFTVSGSIASSATRRYLSYSEADFEFFRPAGATRCTNRCNDKGTGPPKLKFLLIFDQNV